MIKYNLSKVIPVRMTSQYDLVMGTNEAPYFKSRKESWWQWRGQIFRHFRSV